MEPYFLKDSVVPYLFLLHLYTQSHSPVSKRQKDSIEWLFYGALQDQIEPVRWTLSASVVKQQFPTDRDVVGFLWHIRDKLQPVYYQQKDGFCGVH